MALDARTRSSIYRKLIPVLGERDANDLMSEFPAAEADELVTKQFLRAELALTKGELRAEITGLGTELRGEIAGLRTELRTGLANVENRLTVRLGGAIGAATGVLAALVTLQ